MRIHARPLDLPLYRPFTISRGSHTLARNILVEIEHEGITGRGEGAPNLRYGQSQTSALAAFEDFHPPPHSTPYHIEDLTGSFSAHAPGQSAARCALESALWDWVGLSGNRPLCRLLALDPHSLPPSSFTISIDNLRGLAERIQEAKDWPILKLKLAGGDHDQRAVEELRRWTRKPFRVDVNEAWSEDEAEEKIPWLHHWGCELIEQPLPAGQLEAVRRIRENSPVPLIADEDAYDLEAISQLEGVYDGVNVKLMKAGGVREAVAMIHTARGLGLEVMLGCFVESSLGIAAAAHLSPLARWCDLDGAALLEDDPFRPPLVSAGVIRIPTQPGLGVLPA